MLVVLSPAKSLNFDIEPREDLPITEPILVDQAQILLSVLKKKSARKLKALMHISDALAELNRGRYEAMRLPPTPVDSKPAIEVFRGDTYRGFDADSLTDEDLVWAQDHVAILSGLFGVLRPLDLIQPYRLEMGTRLSTRRGKDLYGFWKDRPAKALAALLEDHDDDTIINCASNEYWKAVLPAKLPGRVIDTVFQDVKDGNARVLGLFAKQARGNMARWVVEQRAELAQDIQEFDGMGYAFVPALSNESTYVFQRDQPPPVGG